MKSRPKIKKPFPGPKAKKILKRDHAILSPSFTRSYPFVMHKGRGVWVSDPDGNLFLDFTAGIAVTSTGHCHPKVVKAIQKQSKKYIHMSGTDFYYEPQIELAERLAKLAPGKSKKKVFFTNSGAESVEAAFKLARYATKREKMISFFGAFHGRTLGALSLTGSKVKQRENFGQLVPGVTHINYPYAYRYPQHLKTKGDVLDCVDYLEKVIFKRTVPAKEVAGIIVEPIQGEGGYIVPPPEFHKKLRKLATKYGIMLIMDEVQAGMGRTGKMFAINHWGIEPDIITLAKGIASGMPLGAIIAKASIMKWEPGAHASTFGGNPVSCAAAIETVNLLEKKLIENAATVGAYLKDQLLALHKKFPLIGDVRGLGLMVAIEIVKDRNTKEPAPAIRDKLVDESFKRGLLLLGCGDTAIRFSPALVVSKKEVDTAMKILEESLRVCSKRKK